MRLPSYVGDDFHVADVGDEVDADEEIVELFPAGAGFARTVAAYLNDAQPHAFQHCVVPFLRLDVEVACQYQEPPAAIR